MIKWPWVSRKEFDRLREYCELTAACTVESLGTMSVTVSLLENQVLELKHRDIAKQVAIPKDRLDTLDLSLPVSRGGWRGLSTAMSERTIPAEADSMAQLGKRVADAGGKA